MGYGPWGCRESDTTERLHFHSFMVRGSPMVLSAPGAGLPKEVTLEPTSPELCPTQTPRTGARSSLVGKWGKQMTFFEKIMAVYLFIYFGHSP